MGGESIIYRDGSKWKINYCSSQGGWFYSASGSDVISCTWEPAAGAGGSVAVRYAVPFKSGRLRYHHGKRVLEGGCAGECCGCQHPCGGGGDCDKYGCQEPHNGMCDGDCRWTCCSKEGRRSSWPGCQPCEAEPSKGDAPDRGAEGRWYCGKKVASYFDGERRWCKVHGQLQGDSCGCDGRCGPGNGCQCEECYMRTYVESRFKMQSTIPSGGCRVRLDPSTDSKQVGSIEWGKFPDDTVRVVKVDGIWCKLAPTEITTLRSSYNFEEHDPKTQGWFRYRTEDEALFKRVEDDLMKGEWVVRGPDWEWDDQDGLSLIHI